MKHLRIFKIIVFVLLSATTVTSIALGVTVKVASVFVTVYFGFSPKVTTIG